MMGQILVNGCSTIVLRKVLLHVSFYLVVIILMALSVGCAPELGDSDAALALEDIVTGDSPSRLKAKTPSPARSTVNYTIDGRDNFADLYLSPEGARAGIILIPGVVAGLLDKLSARVRKEMNGIDPAQRDLSQIRARVILLHGRGDTMIPYSESISIAKALPAEQVTLFLIEGYAHTDVKPKREDLPKIIGAMELLLDQRVDENQYQHFS